MDALTGEETALWIEKGIVWYNYLNIAETGPNSVSITWR
jgi:hypothetical protein